MCNYAQYSLANALMTFNIDVAKVKVNAEPLANCNALVNDTRQLQQGDVFCAVIGENQDGRDYIEQAINSGARVIIAECTKAEQHGQISAVKEHNQAILVIQFYQLNKHLFVLCQQYYQQPQKAFTLVGVTGTNGKTSTCQIIAKLLAAQQKNCALIGTLGAGKLDNLTEIANTTPGATELHHYLLAFKAQAVDAVAMEVSSHALSQARIKSDIIDIAVFTNLTRDHLDYHHTMAAYSEAKKAIFSGQKTQFAVLNFDDPQTQQWLSQWHEAQPYIVYGRNNLTQLANHQYFVSASHIQHQHNGIAFTLTTHLGEQAVFSPLLGDFNIDNVLAAVAVLLASAVQTQLQSDQVEAQVKIPAETQLAQIAEAIMIATKKGLRIPIVYNCGGYESTETLKLLDGIVDIYMPDIKYSNNKNALKYSGAGDYWDVVRQAVKEMHRQVGDLVIENGIALRGLLIRHLVLPNNIAGSKEVFKFIAEEISKDTYVNIMAQYRPCFNAFLKPELSRRITADEYLEAVQLAKEAGLRRLELSPWF